MSDQKTEAPTDGAASGLALATGSEFEAYSGKSYARWRVESEVLTDATGVRFVWCVLVRKICGGHLRKRSRHVWPLHMIPHQRQPERGRENCKYCGGTGRVVWSAGGSTKVDTCRCVSIPNTEMTHTRDRE